LLVNCPTIRRNRPMSCRSHSMPHFRVAQLPKSGASPGRASVAPAFHAPLAAERKLPETTPKPTFTLGLDD
jgi:hypothetical protein